MEEKDIKLYAVYNDDKDGYVNNPELGLMVYQEKEECKIALDIYKKTNKNKNFSIKTTSHLKLKELSETNKLNKVQ